MKFCTYMTHIKTMDSTAFFPVFALRENHKSHLLVNSFESLMLFLTIRFLFNEFTAHYSSRIVGLATNFCIIHWNRFWCRWWHFPTYFESIQSGRYLYARVYHGLCISCGMICISEFPFNSDTHLLLVFNAKLRSWMDRMGCAHWRIIPFAIYFLL